MMNLAQDISTNLVASIIFWFISVIITYIVSKYIQKRKSEKQYKIRYKNALNAFSGDLKRIIFLENTNKITQARAIVAARDATLNQLDSLKETLNSEIDTLKKQLSNDAPQLAIAETIDVLRINWPTKKNLIDVQTRRVLITLGLSEITNDKDWK